jgi:hypothetical protein
MTSRPAHFPRGAATPNRVIDCGPEAQLVNRLDAMFYPYAREITCEKRFQPIERRRDEASR